MADRTLIVVAVLGLLATVTNCELYRPRSSTQLKMYRHRTNILYQQLEAENCPVLVHIVEKRNLLSERVDKQLEVEKIFYGQLLDHLIACQKQSLDTVMKTTTISKPSPSTTLSTSTTAPTTTTTTTPTTTRTTMLTTTPTTTTTTTPTTMPTTKPTTTPTTTPTTMPTTTSTTTPATSTQVSTTTTSTSNVSDCQALWKRGVRKDGVYTLAPEGGKTYAAWCQFDAYHGWTVIQKRYDGSVNFYRNWADYKRGFGEPEGEYWLGNDNIYALTRTNRNLSIYLRRYDGQEGTANYSTFYINNEGDNYRLTVGGYSGTVEDKMAYHNNQQFSTRDRDQDGDGGNCADVYTGAWWFKSCHHSNLNGVWTSSRNGGGGNMVWGGSWSGGNSKPLQRTTMMVTRD